MLGLVIASVALLAASHAHAAPPAISLGTPQGGEPDPEPAATPGKLRKPPRISGTYLGMAVWPAITWVYSPNLEVDQRSPLGGGGGALRLGQAVFPWLTIGVDAGGAFVWNRDRFFMKGGLLIDFGFYPVPKYPLSIHAGFGFGAGLVLDDRVAQKGGVGGPQFTGALRYEFFPGAAIRRPTKAGGWAVGPELAWRGFTPAGKGKPMSNSIVLGIWFAYYWGK
jgi:hypothetical protein